jgi:hypothetical protein
MTVTIDFQDQENSEGNNVGNIELNNVEGTSNASKFRLKLREIQRRYLSI